MISVPELPIARDRSTKYSLTLDADSMTVQYKDDAGNDIPGTYETFSLHDVRAVFPLPATPAGAHYPHEDQLRWGVRLDGRLSRTWDIQDDVDFSDPATVASLNTYVAAVLAAVETAQA